MVKELHLVWQRQLLHSLKCYTSWVKGSVNILCEVYKVYRVLYSPAKWLVEDVSRVIHDSASSHLHHRCHCVPLLFGASWVPHALAALQPRFYTIIRAEVLVSVPIFSVI